MAFKIVTFVYSHFIQQIEGDSKKIPLSLQKTIEQFSSDYQHYLVEKKDIPALLSPTQELCEKSLCLMGTDYSRASILRCYGEEWDYQGSIDFDDLIHHHQPTSICPPFILYSSNVDFVVKWGEEGASGHREWFSFDPLCLDPLFDVHLLPLHFASCMLHPL